MRPKTTNAARTLSILLAIAMATNAAADDLALDGSVDSRLRMATERAVERQSGESVLDAPPSDEEAAPATESSRTARPSRSSRGGRRWTDGPRRIPTPSGRSLERARELDLGTHETGTHLLHHAPRPEWKRAAGRAQSTNLRWPVDVGAIGRGFGFVRHDRPHIRHNGFDIATPRGMVIRAAAEGIVAYASNELRGYGSCILIVHPNGWVTLYAHADRITVQPGYRVRRGERIGFVGATGRADGPHLHFELHVDGSAVDPRTYFDGEPWIEGREHLNVLRRNNGGHTYGHLGEIEADYGADSQPRSDARTVRASNTRRGSRTTRASAAATERETPARATAVATRETTAPAARETPAPIVATRETPAPAPTARETPVRAAVVATRETPARAAAPTPVAQPAPAAPSLSDRLLAEGPSSAERRGLTSIRTSGFAAPIRLEIESTFRAGVLRYEAALGTNIRASAPGRVVFLGRDVRGARTTVILAHENGFISVYSGAMDTTVSLGAIVAIGDRLGIVRDSSFGFLFELLDRGQALDPRPRFAVTPTEVVATR